MRKLLIADDEEAVRSLVRMTLEVDSFEILEAGDGPEALAMARRHRPDLVLLDVAMPGLSGFEVCRALKGDPATASMTVIMLTAKAQDSERQQGLDAGADDYFTKPFSPLVLLTRVDELFADEGSS